MGKLNHVKDKVVKMLAVGDPQTSIAKKMGVDQSTISRFANEEEAMKKVEQQKLILTEVIPDAVQNVKDLVEEMKDIPKEDIERRKLSYGATKDVLKAVNVFPSPQYAHNIYNDNSQHITITPAIQEWIDYKSRIKLDPDGKVITEAKVVN